MRQYAEHYILSLVQSLYAGRGAQDCWWKVLNSFPLPTQRCKLLLHLVLGLLPPPVCLELIFSLLSNRVLLFLCVIEGATIVVGPQTKHTSFSCDTAAVSLLLLWLFLLLLFFWLAGGTCSCALLTNSGRRDTSTIHLCLSMSRITPLTDCPSFKSSPWICIRKIFRGISQVTRVIEEENDGRGLLESDLW